MHLLDLELRQYLLRRWLIASLLASGNRVRSSPNMLRFFHKKHGEEKITTCPTMHQIQRKQYCQQKHPPRLPSTMLHSGRMPSMKHYQEQLHPPADVTKCPKVFLYQNLSTSLRDDPNKLLSIETVFGEDFSRIGSFRTSCTVCRGTHHHSLARIVEYRLRLQQQTSSHAECFTSDPNQADLFFVPIFTQPKKTHKWHSICNNTPHLVDKIRNELLYFNSSTACKHIFAVSKSFGSFSSAGTACKGWWYDPVPPFDTALRVGYSGFSLKPDALPNLFSVPYPSTVHGKLEPYNREKEYLMLFTGQDNHGDTEVRRTIVSQCRGYQNASKCHALTSITHSGDPRLFQKQNTVFCLEPVGDSPWRKSISDSIGFHCIPVFFSERTDDVPPFSMSHWKKQGRVLVPRQAFVEGKIDLYRLLSSIPDQLLRILQETVETYSHQYLYNTKHDPGDALSLMFVGLWNHSLTMQQNGVCLASNLE